MALSTPLSGIGKGSPAGRFADRSGTRYWRYLIALVFALSIVGKAMNPQDTLRVLLDVWALPLFAARAAFVALLSGEAVIAALLVASGDRRVSRVAAGLICIVSLSIGRQILTGSALPCGCGSLIGKSGSVFAGHWASLIRNLFLLAFCWLDWSRRGSPSRPAI